MKHLGRVAALAISCAILGTAASSWAAVRIERGNESITQGTNNGEEGYWVEYDEYYYESLLDRLKKLDPSLTDAQIKQILVLLNGKTSVTDEELKKLIASLGINGQIKTAFTNTLGNMVNLTDDVVNAIANKINSGGLTLANLNTYLTQLKVHLTNISTTGRFPYSNAPATNNYDFHVRPYTLTELEARWGTLTGQFGGSDWEGRRSKILQEQSNPNNTSFYHNTNAVLSQAFRFMKIAELMDKIGAPSLSFSTALTGNFAQYDGSRSYDTYNQNDPMLRKFVSKTGYTVWNGYSDLFRISVPAFSTTEAWNFAKALYREAIMTASPIAFDLNGDGVINVTGKSTAQIRNPRNTFVAADSLMFDLLAKGTLLRTEWLKAKADGFLVDDRAGQVTKAAQGDGKIDGSVLFGNAGGHMDGFIKLSKVMGETRLASARSEADIARLLSDPSGIEGVGPKRTVSGNKLDGLKVWADDNHDGLVQMSELKKLSDLGITEMALVPKYVQNTDGEWQIQGEAVRNGKTILTEDVWFAIDGPDHKPGKQ